MSSCVSKGLIHTFTCRPRPSRSWKKTVSVLLEGTLQESPVKRHDRHIIANGNLWHSCHWLDKCLQCHLTNSQLAICWGLQEFPLLFLWARGELNDSNSNKRRQSKAMPGHRPDRLDSWADKSDIREEALLLQNMRSLTCFACLPLKLCLLVMVSQWLQ